ncbi:hypothetical protein [Streptomyces sp. NPDC037389]|uniref:hypothetical protein n=1 Tax=Streptomyces sp. NPDC037389 TaxID=3155369 RepID=UPI0033C6D50E
MWPRSRTLEKDLTAAAAVLRRTTAAVRAGHTPPPLTVMSEVMIDMATLLKTTAVYGPNPGNAAVCYEKAGQLLLAAQELPDLAPTARTSALSASATLVLVHELRVPVPGPDRNASITVLRDSTQDRPRWAVTTGCLFGVRAWTDTGWQYISSIGRPAAFRYNLDGALTLAHQVARTEPDRRRAEIEAARTRPSRPQHPA